MRSEIYSEEHQKLRDILKRERKAAGVRQVDIAAATNRFQAYISKFEMGDLRLDVIDLIREVPSGITPLPCVSRIA